MSDRKDSLIKNIHKIFREDKYLNSLFYSYGKELNTLDLKTFAVSREYFFDTMSIIGINIMEKELDFNTSGTIEDRRSQIEARWKTSGKCDIDLLQDIADSWRYGEASVDFRNAKIVVTFLGITGVPEDFENLKISLEMAKPAHIPIEFVIKLRTHGQLRAYTHVFLSQFTHLELGAKETLEPPLNVRIIKKE